MLFSNLLALFLGSTVYGQVLNDLYMDREVNNNNDNDNKKTFKFNPNLKYDPDFVKNIKIGESSIDKLISNAEFVNALKNMPDVIRRLVIRGLVAEMSIRRRKAAFTQTGSRHTNIPVNEDNITEVIPSSITEVIPSSTTEAASLNKCTKQFSCLNCTTVRICAPSPVTQQLEEITQVHCSEDKPYCDEATGSCVASVETALKCATPSPDFICLKDGYFPHPTACDKYYLCMDYKPYVFKCKQDYYYNTKSHACDLYYYSSNCYSFPCKGQHGVKVSYSFDSTYYAYCIGHKPFFIDRCDGSYKLNVTSQKCEPVCNHNGLYEDVTDCTAYFKCVKNGLLYRRTRHWCPNNEGFDPSEFQCVPLTQMSNCKPQLDNKN